MSRDSIAEADSESVKCNLCGSSQSEMLYNVRSFNIVRCAVCRLVYVNPRLSVHRLKKIYNAPDYYDGGYPDYKSKRRFIRWESGALLRNIGRFMGKASGRILDVGCSFGYFLDAAREMGYEARGIEISEHASIYARDELGLDVKTWSLDEAVFDPEAFDVVTMWDVLEHLTDPQASLEKIHGWLRPGGILALATPNLGSPLARWTQGRWEQIKPEYHLYYFTKDTVKDMCEAAGFSVLRISTIGLGGTCKLITGNRCVPARADCLITDTSRFKLFVKQMVNMFSEITRTGEKLYVYARK